MATAAPATTTPVDGAAAFRVLTNAPLFRDVVSWSSGWPALVVRRWHELQDARADVVFTECDVTWCYTAHPERRRFASHRVFAEEETPVSGSASSDVDAVRLTTVLGSHSYDLKEMVSNFWKRTGDTKSLAHEFMWVLIWRREIRTLELTKRANHEHFVLDNIEPAIRSGDADAVRLAHRFSSRTGDHSRRGYWRLAVVTFPGHVNVLEALHGLERLDEEDVRSMVEGWRSTYHDRVYPSAWGLAIPRIDSVVLAEWLVAKLGPVCLPRSLIHIVALRGKLDLVRFLHTVVGQEIEPTTFRSVYRLAGHQHDERLTFLSILDFLLRHRPEVDADDLGLACFEAGDHEMLSRIQEIRGLQFLDGVNVDLAASRGHLGVLQLATAHVHVTCTTEAMDGAAANGYNDVVEFLHDLAFPGCTTAAMDLAAGNGHLRIVQFLHENRVEGCTMQAMDFAASKGFVDVVKFLHENRHEGCTTHAMDNAIRNGHRHEVQFLHENREEGCTSAAFTYPQPTTKVSTRQHDGANTRSSLFYALEHRTEPHSENLEFQALWAHDLEVLEAIQRARGLKYLQDVEIDDLAGSGNIELIRFLAKHVPVKCTPMAMDSAAANNHLEVVRYLHETRVEGCTTMAMDLAASSNHWDTVSYLDEHRFEGCTGVLLVAATRLGRLDLVQQYSIRVPPSDYNVARVVAGVYGHTAIQDFLSRE